MQVRIPKLRLILMLEDSDEDQAPRVRALDDTAWACMPPPGLRIISPRHSREGRRR